MTEKPLAMRAASLRGVSLSGYVVPTSRDKLKEVRDAMTSVERKGMPLWTCVFEYFPDALLALAECSRISNDQHNPGEPPYWNREKSTDHADCLLRHMVDRGRVDSDGVRHSVKVLWRAAAMVQLELEEAASKAAASGLERPARKRSTPRTYRRTRKT